MEFLGFRKNFHCTKNEGIAELATFSEEILNGKLRFFCAVIGEILLSGGDSSLQYKRSSKFLKYLGFRRRLDEDTFQNLKCF